jgi:hypothetical protein
MTTTMKADELLFRLQQANVLAPGKLAIAREVLVNHLTDRNKLITLDEAAQQLKIRPFSLFLRVENDQILPDFWAKRDVLFSQATVSSMQRAPSVSGPKSGFTYLLIRAQKGRVLTLITAALSDAKTVLTMTLPSGLTLQTWRVNDDSALVFAGRTDNRPEAKEIQWLLRSVIQPLHMGEAYRATRRDRLNGQRYLGYTWHGAFASQAASGKWIGAGWLR